MIITVETNVNLSKEKVWEIFTQPKHITNWNFASDDWFCPSAENNLKIGEKFSYRMEAKDGSFGFDFWGTYTEIIEFQHIYSILGDGRKLEVEFFEETNGIKIIERFEAENENSAELQKQGWQAILNNFKNYAECL